MTNTKMWVAVLLALGAMPLAAKDLVLLPVSDGDQVPAKLVAAKIALPPQAERAPVEFTWALDPAEKLVAPTPYVAESREYWTEVDGRALAKGLVVRTTSQGAVVRLSPRAGNGSPELDAADVVVRQHGRTLEASHAIADSDVAREFKALGMALPERSLAFRLSPEVEAGAFELSLPKARGGYLLHVFEPASTDVLSLTTSRNTVVAGGELEVVASLASPSGRTLGRIAGLATSPSGEAVELEFAHAKDGTWRARFAPGASLDAGLWEVHAFAASEDGALARDAKVAFAAAKPTARFVGGERIDAEAPAIRVGVEVAAAGRYNVAAVLYATDAAGTLVPAAIAHSAAVLSPGRHALPLRFATDALVSSGLRAPFEVRDLALTNQGDLTIVEHRARAFVLE